MERKKIIIFSLGGTLLLSNDDVINIWRKALKKNGLSPDELIIYEFYGDDFERVVLSKMSAKYGWKKSQVEAVAFEAKRAFRDINLLINSTLVEKLASLKKLGYSLGILSNRKLVDIKDGLEKINCSLELFDFIKTAENGAHKPDPKAFDIMFANFEPAEMIFVGSDHNKDWPAAKALGIDFVAISPPLLIGLWQALGVREGSIFPNVPSYLDSLLDDWLSLE